MKRVDPIMPWRAPATRFPTLVEGQSPHLLLETLGDVLLPPLAKFHDTAGRRMPRFDNKDMMRFVNSGTMSWGQALLITEANLKGEILNGGVDQFFFNSPFLAIEIPEVLDRFAPAEGALVYRRIIPEMTRAMARFSLEDPVDHDLLHEICELPRSRHGDVLSEFEDAFCGLDETLRFADDPVSESSWSNMLADTVVRYVMANKTEFVMGA